MLVFHSCDKIPGKTLFRKGNTYFGSRLHTFQIVVAWLPCFWACGEEEHHDRQHMVQQKALELTSWRPESTEKAHFYNKAPSPSQWSYEMDYSTGEIRAFVFQSPSKDLTSDYCFIRDQAFNRWAFEGHLRSKPHGLSTQHSTPPKYIIPVL